MRTLAISVSTLVLGMAVTLSAVGTSLAGDGAAAITERQAIMKLQGGSATAIIAAIRSNDADQLKKVEWIARALAFSASALPTMFPKGSDSAAGKTAALPKIWQDTAGFKKAADNMGALAGKLGDALKAGDAAAARAAFGDLGKNGCDGCHDTYRAKQ